MENRPKSGKLSWIAKWLVSLLALGLSLLAGAIAWAAYKADAALPAVGFTVLVFVFLALAWFVWRSRNFSWRIGETIAGCTVALVALASISLVVYLYLRINNVGSSEPEAAAEAPESAANDGAAEPSPPPSLPEDLGQTKSDAAAAAASAGPSDFYNVNFSPGADRNDTTEIVDQQLTTADFYIGPESEPNNAVPSENAPVSAQLEQQGAQNLTITLSCAFCDGDRLLKRVIAFVPGSRSTDAIFAITPDRRYGTRNHDNLVFEVTGANGVVYDNVVVPVAVVANTPAAGGKNAQFAGVTASLAAHPSQPENSRPVDLTISMSVKDNRIVMTLDPSDEGLAKLFAGRERQAANGSSPCTAAPPNCNPREFQTGLTPESLSQELRNDYTSLDSLVSEDASLHQLLEGSSSPLPGLSGKTDLSQDEENALLSEIHADGNLLYTHLFFDGQSDADLGALIKQLDSYLKPGGAPLLVRIEEQSVFLPWQFLHPSGPMDAGKFWGFRYELVEDPQSRSASGYLAGALEYEDSSTIFGKYHASGQEDQVVSSEGDLYAQMLASVGLGHLKSADSKADFLSNLKANQDSVGVVAIFTHAVNDLPQGNSAPAPLGPEMFFRLGDFVTVRDLQKLYLGLDYTDIFYRHPLVFLNACQTGTAANSAIGEWTFPTTFLDMGARGVVATEAPIWPAFAYDFGSAMMKSLGTSKEPVSLVLLNTRSDFLRRNHNPLGLLFSYYGGVDASLVVR